MANPIKIVKAVKKAAAKKSASNANKRGLKAANKPVSKNNRNRFGDGEMSAYLKNTPPARPNRIRGGSMQSKLNWPESMTNTPKKINTELPKKNKFAKRSALHNEFKSNVDTTGMTSAQKRYAKNKYFIEKMNKNR